MKRALLVSGCIFLFAASHAQIEGTYFSSGSFKRTGFGIFTNIAFPVSCHSMVTWEGESIFFNQIIAAAPITMGWRHICGPGTGFYIEPQLGFSIINSDIVASDSSKSSPNQPGNTVKRPDANGPTAGLNSGYIFPGKLALNIGIHYTHLFPLGGGPASDMVSLRLTHTIICGKKYHPEGLIPSP
jgi:hypothetical protein